jgi:hypothetical protein
MNARGLTLAGLVSLCVVGVLMLGVAPAFAAAPEAPGPVTVEGVTASSARFRGVLNPGKEGPAGTYELGTYEFLYKEGAGMCEGGSVAPASPGISLGGGGEEVPQIVNPEQAPGLEVGGLAAHTEYTVCLLAREGIKGETAVGPAVTFTTAIPPETPEELEAKPVAATTATLNGVLNPGKAGEAGSYEFLYRQSTSECQGEHEVKTPQTAATGAKGERATTNAEGLLPGMQYTFCLRAHNEAGEEATSAPVTFTTLAAAPKVEEVFVSDVASTSATFDAKVDPGGPAPTYTFEYAPAGGAFAPVPGTEGSGSIAAGAAGVSLSVHVDGLQPSTAYEFRVVVGNSMGAGTSETSFTTQQSGEFVLPDGRQWEMVTPPQKEGSLFSGSLGKEYLSNEGVALEESGIAETDNEVVIQASASGDGIVDQAVQPVEAEPQGDANGVSVFSTRGPSGWSSQGLPVSHGESTNPGLGFGSEYRFFSEDLSLGVLQQVGNFTPLAPEAVESTPYLHANYLNGNVEERCERPDLGEGSCFQSLVTRGDTEAGVVFGDEVDGECSFGLGCGPHLVAGTPDLSHVILVSREQLTSTPIAVAHSTVGAFRYPPLYEWSGGQLQLLNVLPGTEEGDGELQLAAGNKRRVVSDDGERVILENGGTANDVGRGGALYLRDVAKSETIPLNIVEPGCGACSGGGEGVQYMTANSEGSRVFFLDTSKLTSDSSGESRALFECEIVEVEGGLGCDLSDLTPETGGELANVRMVLGASEDGSYVYFVAGGVLAPGATKQGCSETSSEIDEPCNLYVRHDGVTTFIARLASVDANFFGLLVGDQNTIEYTGLRARVSPSGRWLAFMSDRDLTGYDTREVAGGEPDEEVYLYDAGASTLACASCDPTGERPVGLIGEGSTTQHFGVASIVPGWDGFEEGYVSGIDQIYQPRYLSDSGRLFFDSKDALVPRDVNGAVDVYEYEPEGVPAAEHACSSATQSASEVFKPAHGFEVEGRGGEEGAGCVALISSGTSPEESSFLDASESGGDVFFLTTSRLAPQDFDNAPDVYDAHECTAGSPCTSVQAVQPPPCDTEGSCRGAPAPQPAIYGAPSSATFTGSGNLAPVSSAPAAPRVVKKTTGCGRDFVKKRGRCVRRKTKSGKAKRAGRVRDDRRGRS